MERDETSALRLEQYILGELPPAEARRLREALERDELLRAKLSAIEESDREILASYPPKRMAAAIRERLSARESLRAPQRRAPSFMIALPAAAAILVFFSIFFARERLLPRVTSPAFEQTRLKGVQPHLSIYRKGAEGAEELSSGASARPRDVLQVAYTAGEARYGVIFSIDSRGALSWHLPQKPAGSSAAAPLLDQQGQVALPSAYELDDAPLFERFFFVNSAAPFSLRDVEQAAKGLASRPRAAERDALALPKDLKQSSVVIRKQ